MISFPIFLHFPPFYAIGSPLVEYGERFNDVIMICNKNKTKVVLLGFINNQKFLTLTVKLRYQIINGYNCDGILEHHSKGL